MGQDQSKHSNSETEPHVDKRKGFSYTVNMLRRIEKDDTLFANFSTGVDTPSEYGPDRMFEYKQSILKLIFSQIDSCTSPITELVISRDGITRPIIRMMANCVNLYKNLRNIKITAYG